MKAFAEGDRVEVDCDIQGWRGKRGSIVHLSEHGFYVVKMDDADLTLKFLSLAERILWERRRDWPTVNFESGELRKLSLLEALAEAAK